MRRDLIILYVKLFAAESGVDEFKLLEFSTTIAYQGVMVPGSQGQENRIGTLFITVPHTLAGDVIGLIITQNLVSFAIIFSIASISVIVTIILLRWNRILKNVVDQKTSQLTDSIEKLEKANEDLQSHDKLQKEFINVAAHELRTPTQAISGNLELVEMTYLPSILQRIAGTLTLLHSYLQGQVDDKLKAAVDSVRQQQSFSQLQETRTRTSPPTTR